MAFWEFLSKGRSSHLEDLCLCKTFRDARASNAASNAPATPAITIGQASCCALNVPSREGARLPVEPIEPVAPSLRVFLRKGGIPRTSTPWALDFLRGIKATAKGTSSTSADPALHKIPALPAEGTGPGTRLREPAMRFLPAAPKMAPGPDGWPILCAFCKGCGFTEKKFPHFGEVTAFRRPFRNLPSFAGVDHTPLDL